MAEDNKILRLVYTLFLGVLLAVFVGVGTATFYTSPKMPQYPIELNTGGKVLTPTQIETQNNFDRQMRAYDNAMKPYNRNTSIITLCAGVIFLVISLVFEHRIKLLADGVLLGGLFTLIYSIGRGFASQDTKYTFLTVTIGLIVVVFLGYHRFVKEKDIVGDVKK